MSVRRAEPPCVALSDVSFAYRAAGEPPRRVLSGVTLAAEHGEFLALVGPNGSGKTTLLRLLAGTLNADGGTVVLSGDRVDRLSRGEVARRVAVLPQTLALPSGFRVRELVELGRAPHARSLFGATPDDRRAVADALRDAGAAEVSERYVEDLSGGERQRALVAMALAQQPELLLLDEPTVHLDIAHQVALLDALRGLQRQRRLTVIGVLHDLTLAASHAERVAVLHDGRIEVGGSPEEVLRAPLVERVFGVPVDEAVTAGGTRHLVVRAAGMATQTRPAVPGSGLSASGPSASGR